MKLTVAKIKSAPATGKLYYIWDSEVKGFGVRVSPAGAKAFVLAYRQDGRQRFYSYGRVDKIKLAETRKVAKSDVAALLLGGKGPAERQDERQEAPTVADVVREYFETYVPVRIAKGKMSATTAKKYEAQAHNHVLPALGTMRAADVEQQDVERMAESLINRPVLHNRTLAFASTLFVRCEAWGYRPQNSNPVKFVERMNEEPRDRTLNAEEIRRLSESLHVQDGKNSMATAVIRMLMITGLRVSEVLGMEWENIDTDTGRLLIPESKTGRRWHDLPSAALALLKRLPRPDGLARVFACHRGPIQYKTVRLNFKEALGRAGIYGVTLHDLRRTLATRAASNPDMTAPVLRDLLGHKTMQMAQRYIRHVGNPVRDAREQAGAEMAELMGEPAQTAEILNFRK